MSAGRMGGRPRIGVAYAPGTNSHVETAEAVNLAGGDGQVALAHDLLSGREALSEYQGLIFPGGFSFGDHIAAGRVFAVQLTARMRDQFQEFALKRPILGICNGYQALMEMGLLPSGVPGERFAALAQNRSARYESRWNRLLVQNTGTFWTEGLAGKTLRLPVAHAEGRMVVAPGVAVKPAFLYVDDAGHPTEDYPFNPAGSPGGAAGIVGASGLVLGMMPHPERAALAVHGSTDGLALFERMVRYCRE
jgi:phosphoribosylformylglycinamidine synthase subunit PurQ / glutaminase